MSLIHSPRISTEMRVKSQRPCKWSEIVSQRQCRIITDAVEAAASGLKKIEILERRFINKKTPKIYIYISIGSAIDPTAYAIGPLVQE